MLLTFISETIIVTIQELSPRRANLITYANRSFGSALQKLSPAPENTGTTGPAQIIAMCNQKGGVGQTNQ